MKTILIIWALLSLSVQVSAFDVFLIRHAEKQLDASVNPDLTTQGRKTASVLAEVLKKKDISTLYSTNYKRTLQTATPLANMLDKKIALYDPSKPVDLLNTITNNRENCLVVGHSNTIPQLIMLLSHQKIDPIAESEYGTLYKVSFNQQGPKLSQSQLEVN
ncbi:MAG: SixA phosphatase family protein [bacterium]